MGRKRWPYLNWNGWLNYTRLSNNYNFVIKRNGEEISSLTFDTEAGLFVDEGLEDGEEYCYEITQILSNGNTISETKK